MTKTISITLSKEIYNRLEQVRKVKGNNRSGVILKALFFYLGMENPDPKVIKRWKHAYEKISLQEPKEAERWQSLQGSSLGQP